MAQMRPIEHNVENPGQPITEKKRKKRQKNLIFYPLGTIGRDMMYYLFNSCILTYILFTKQLTSEQLVAITVIMVAARVFDALNDPIMGNIIERTRTRWGKFKPWLLAGILSTSIVIYLAFNSTLQGWPFIIFFGFIYFAICFCLSGIIGPVNHGKGCRHIVLMAETEVDFSAAKLSQHRLSRAMEDHLRCAVFAVHDLDLLRHDAPGKTGSKCF